MLTHVFNSRVRSTGAAKCDGAAGVVDATRQPDLFTVEVFAVVDFVKTPCYIDFVDTREFALTS